MERSHSLNVDTVEQQLTKPRIVYFRWSLEKAPLFVKRLFDRHFITGLSAHFDLTVVSQNCDYGEVCERARPDICLFESGNNGYQDPRLEISNTGSHPHIPKIGFLRSDPMCVSRSIFFSDMDRWGVSTFFTYVTSSGEYTPEVSDAIYYWPTAVDPSIYVDRGLEKVIPVLFVGNSEAKQYPWRRRMRKLLSKHFPTFTETHLGWSKRDARHALYDESYSKLINSAIFAPTCSGITKCLVNKLLEIPASGTCLVTEPTPVMSAMGFVDMKNCVLADEADIVDKLEHLLDNRDRLSAITKAGHDLVHQNHVPSSRSQIFDWYQLHKRLQPGQKIIQRSMFGKLDIEDAQRPRPECTLISNPPDLVLLRQGDEHVKLREFETAEHLYKEALSFVPYMSEPRVRLALCEFYRGNAQAGAEHLIAVINELIVNFKSPEPDPVEWSLYILMHLCLGNTAEAVKSANTFYQIPRLELVRSRWLAYSVAGMSAEASTLSSALETQPSGMRRSIHTLMAGWSIGDYITHARWMLDACGQHETSQRTASAFKSLPMCNSKPETEIIELQGSTGQLTTPRSVSINNEAWRSVL